MGFRLLLRCSARTREVGGGGGMASAKVDGMDTIQDEHMWSCRLVPTPEAMPS